MNILLIVPSRKTYYGRPRYPVTGISMIGSVLLKAGYSVKAVDMRLSKSTDQRLMNLVRSEKIDIVGFTVTNWDFTEAIRIAAMIKSFNDNIKIVFGGPQPSLCINETLAYEEVDFVVYGEGEETFLELIENLSSVDSDYRHINSLCYRDERGRIILNPPRPLIAVLDSLPYPAYELFEYEEYAALGQRRLGISATRGCPYGCIFCTGSSLMGRTTRYRSPDVVVAEMKYWANKYNITHFCFNEDNIFGQTGYGEKLLDEIEKSGLDITYSLEVGVRADSLSEKLCKRLADTGCTIVAVGVESSDPVVLKNVNKGETIDEITQGIRNAKKAGLFVKGYFIVGLPGDTFEKTKRSVSYAKKEHIDMPRFALAQAFPNTTLEKWVGNYGTYYYEPLEYVLNHSDEFHGDVHFDFPGFPREEIWKAYLLAKEEAEKFSFRQALLRKFGDKTGKVLNVVNITLVRKFIVFLYQHKFVSLPK